ncbi:MAG: two pore domain potassium channel family protein [Saprospiraceae bacterium]|nr:two pore domain potassium channel family protein [Saprospiraceae bacterium]
MGEHVNFLECSEQLESQIYNFIQSSNNFSANIEGNFWRMFYLSSITVTTVGFGDIVPLTKRARIAVSIEAILGVTFIGFFLNSIGSKMQLRNFE